MKSNKSIVETLNPFVEHHFIKRNAEGEIFEEYSIRIREQREKPDCTFEQQLITVHFGNKIVKYSKISI